MITMPNPSAQNPVDILDENIERLRGNPTHQNMVTMRGMIVAWWKANMISLEQRNAYEQQVKLIHG